MRQTHRLLDAFTEGRGELRSHRPPGDAWASRLYSGVMLQPLPWNVHPERRGAAYLVTWSPGALEPEPYRYESQAMRGFVLTDGQSWCTPELALEAEARLRLEARTIEKGENAELEITWNRKADLPTVVSSSTPTLPTTFDAGSQTDVPLPGEKGRLCFDVKGGAVAIGEPRLLSPEAPGEDPRPRWVILVILDALRGDILQRDDAERVTPTLTSLANRAHQYTRAISPGCHTRAAVYPMMMGRDLMRIDPLKRRQYIPIRSPLASVYGRGNLFLTHLAENVGYHSVFLGNNKYLSRIPAFSRYSHHGRQDTGTVDTVEKLPALLERYGDERVVLMYYITNPHSRSATPTRLIEEYGCADLSGAEQCRCMYDARARHGDEALAALQAALIDHGLVDRSVQIVTSDHGETIKDGMPLEAEMPSFMDKVKLGFWTQLDRGHGSTCHWREVHVPLVIHGQGFGPFQSSKPVSTLDILPTLRSVMDLPRVNRMDGLPLPLSTSPPSPSTGPQPRRFVSYGFCTDSAIEADRQLIWWVEDCRVRKANGGELLDYTSELWIGGTRAATNRSRPELLRQSMAEQERWVKNRLPAGEGLVLDLSGTRGGTLRLTASRGRIIDYGPSSTIRGLGGIKRVRLLDEDRTLAVEFDDYQGLFYVATMPPLAPVRIELDPPAGTRKPMTFAGAFQLPLDLLGREIDPGQHPAFFLSESTPEKRASRRPHLRFWWRRYGPATDESDPTTLPDFARVLREWGYIR